VNLLRAVAWTGRAVFLIVIAIWFVASFAGAYLALFVFWPFLSLGFVIAWAAWRIIGHGDGNVIGVGPRPMRLRRVDVDGSPLPLGRRVFVSVDPQFSVELAPSRWVEAFYLVVSAPFVLQGPLFVAASLFELAGREEPRVVVEWSWLPIGVLLLADFGVSLAAFVAWAGREFVAPGTAGKRIAVPFLGRALCLSHSDVCAIEVGRGLGPSGRNADRIRASRRHGEPVDLIPGAWVSDAGPTAELVPLAELLARAAHVPLLPLGGNAAELGTRS